MRFLGSGKVKDLYEYDNDTLLFRFSDRVSAYDVKFKEDIPEKGKVLCKFAEFWFEDVGCIAVGGFWILRLYGCGVYNDFNHFGLHFGLGRSRS